MVTISTLTGINEKSLSSRWSLQRFFFPSAVWEQQRMTKEELWGVCWPFELVLMGHLFHVCFLFTKSIHLHSGNKLQWYLLPTTAGTFQLCCSYGSGLCSKQRSPSLVELCNNFSFSASGIEDDMQYALHQNLLFLLKYCCLFWSSDGKWNQVEWGGLCE